MTNLVTMSYQFNKINGSIEKAKIQSSFITSGILNREKDNVVVVFHSLFGGYSFDEWIPFIGEHNVIDTKKLFVICVNVLGSCYGSSGPSSINPLTGSIWGRDFPPVHTYDMAKVVKRTLDYLGIKKIQLILSGSFGGLVAQEFIFQNPKFANASLLVATCEKHDSSAIALYEVARMAIDCAFSNCDAKKWPPKDHTQSGLSLSKAILLQGFCSKDGLLEKFGRRKLFSKSEKNTYFYVEEYLRKASNRNSPSFYPDSLLYLTRASDNHNLREIEGRDFKKVIELIHTEMNFISFSSDTFYPKEDLKDFVSSFKNNNFFVLDSIYGHNSFNFLIEPIRSILSKIMMNL